MTPLEAIAEHSCPACGAAAEWSPIRELPDDARGWMADRKSVRCSTGSVSGEYPKSPWKIALLVVGILAIVALIVLFARS